MTDQKNDRKIGAFTAIRPKLPTKKITLPEGRVTPETVHLPGHNQDDKNPQTPKMTNDDQNRQCVCVR